MAISRATQKQKEFIAGKKRKHLVDGKLRLHILTPYVFMPSTHLIALWWKALRSIDEKAETFIYSQKLRWQSSKHADLFGTTTMAGSWSGVSCSLELRAPQLSTTLPIRPWNH